MFFRFNFIRVLAIPACLAWGLTEFIALQRAHGPHRRLRAPKN